MKRVVPALTRSFAVAGSIFLILWIVMDLGNVNLSVPFRYEGDGLTSSSLIKTLADSGLSLVTDRLGAPYQQSLYDIPMSDDLNIAILWLVDLFSGNWAVALNGYFLLTFFLVGLAALFSLRKMGVRNGLAVPLAVLYAFLPYHLLRGENHLFLAAYFMVPLLCWGIWCVAKGVWIEKDGKIQWPTAVQLAVICLAGSSSGIYYTFFAAMALSFFSVVTWINTRHHRNFLASISLVFILGVGTFANLLPSLILSKQTHALVATQRSLGESEIYGLKIAQMILPRTGHNFPPFARVKDAYNRSSPMINENDTATLGFIATLGLMVSLGSIVLRGQGIRRRLADLGKINLFMILVATVGGLSVLIGFLLTKEIRAYNRISVFIAFFSMAAAGALLNTAVDAMKRWKYWRLGTGALGLALLLIGLYDQVPRHFDGSAFRSKVGMDRDYFARVEASLSPKAAVYQLPYMPYPESPPIADMKDYEHLRGYLNTSTIRWSYGALKGSKADQTIAALGRETDTPASFLKDLVFEGYQALYINREGYTDRAVVLESGVSKILGKAPLVSADGKLATYSLVDYKKSLAADPDKWKQDYQAYLDRREGAYVPGAWISAGDPRLVQGGWSVVEPTHQWTLGKEAAFNAAFKSPLKGPSVTLEIQPHLVLGDQIINVSINGHRVGSMKVFPSVVSRLSIPVREFNAPGSNVIELDLPNATQPGNGDFRVLSFALGRLRLDN